MLHAVLGVQGWTQLLCSAPHAAEVSGQQDTSTAPSEKEVVRCPPFQAASRWSSEAQSG